MRKCRKCGQEGHNSRTCEKRNAPPDEAPFTRDESGKFLPGNKGNPVGYSKAAVSARKRLRDYIRGKLEIGEVNTVIDRLIDEMTTTDDGRTLVACAKLLLEYAYGKPVVEVEHSGTIGFEQARAEVNSTMASLTARIQAERDSVVSH